MKRILIYIIVTFSTSWIFWGIQYLSQSYYIPQVFGLFGNLAILGPIVGYVVIKKIDKEKPFKEIKKLFKTSSKKWLYIFAGLSPFILSFIAYTLILIITKERFELGLSLQMIVPIALIILFVGGPIEEFGWRGILHPSLRKKYNILITTLIVGLVHGVWHLPLHFLNNTVQSNIPILEFIAVTVLVTFSYSFIYEFTKGFKPFLLLHWFANLSSALFVYWTSSTGRYYFFGIVLVMDVLLYVYLKNSENKTRSI